MQTIMSSISTYYPKRLPPVEAIQWTGFNLHDLSRFMGNCLGPIERRPDYKPKIKLKDDPTYFWIEMSVGDVVYRDAEGFHITREKYFWERFELPENKPAQVINATNSL